VILEREAQLDALRYDDRGLLPLVAQHARTGEVLLLAYANREALARTLATGELWLYSRSRARLWRKGETSGHTQRVLALHADCDGDAVLARVEPAGPACHTGAWSCFEAPPTLAALDRVLAHRAAEPRPDSYTARLLADENLRLKKLAEEALELALACAGGPAERVAAEAADVVYHTLVACRARGVPLDGVLAELERRLPPSRDATPAGRG